MSTQGPIGIFDSGYGGLTVMRSIVDQLPDYNYLYLGDNARAPYGNRSYETVYRYTLQSVEWLFRKGCPLVILACNTASAKALRTIQQQDLNRIGPDRRVLGVIRPTTEIIGTKTKTGSIGILATQGTVQSGSYAIEINRFYPDVHVSQEACPMWVPLIENNEHESDGAEFFIRQNLNQLLSKDSQIDTILLACTHYPLVMNQLKKHIPEDVRVLSQGEIVAESLKLYLSRHPEIEERCARGGEKKFYTTDDREAFSRQGALFFGDGIMAEHAEL